MGGRLEKNNNNNIKLFFLHQKHLFFEFKFFKNIHHTRYDNKNCGGGVGRWLGWGGLYKLVLQRIKSAYCWYSFAQEQLEKCHWSSYIGFHTLVQPIFPQQKGL